MLSNHRLHEVLEEIADISRIGLILYDEKGKLLVASGEPELDMSNEVEQFARSMAESQILSGYHFFKVAIDQEVEYILLAKANYDEAYMVGRLAVCQIRNMVLANRELSDRNNFMQNILLGNMLVVDIYNKARKLHIEQARRLVYVIEVEGRRESIVMEVVKNLFANRSRDFVTEINEQTVILIKDASSIRTDEDAMKLAGMIVAHIQAEAMVKARVGYGNVVDALPDIAKSYQEAKMALEVGRIFYAGREAISYGRLGIGRLIYQLPMSLCEMFIREVFGDRELDIDDETMVTIQKFFDNSLNISETARQLYIHRNTLVYRLERLQKMIGLDIRNFEDALTFKIAMMVIAHMGEADNE
ncbi:MAG: helix-turn-helix domain-containing protein [Lachnospiraceae bacterium]|nr:helix-turn-helix domain-containing protein [Lachnospiraceae bacterium]